MAAFWRALGANVEIMGIEHHDIVLAMTSHLPHLIAYTVVGMADDLEKLVASSEVIKFSAGGFRDFTRIAASDPTMWRDIFLHNKEAVLELLGRFNEDLVPARARDPLGRGGHAVRVLLAHPRDPPRHRPDGPGFGGARLRSPARAAAACADSAALCGGRGVTGQSNAPQRSLDASASLTAALISASENGLAMTSWISASRPEARSRWSA